MGLPQNSKSSYPFFTYLHDQFSRVPKPLTCGYMPLTINEFWVAISSCSIVVVLSVTTHFCTFIWNEIPTSTRNWVIYMNEFREMKVDIPLYLYMNEISYPCEGIQENERWYITMHTNFLVQFSYQKAVAEILFFSLIFHINGLTCLSLTMAWNYSIHFKDSYLRDSFSTHLLHTHEVQSIRMVLSEWYLKKTEKTPTTIMT